MLRVCPPVVTMSAKDIEGISLIMIRVSIVVPILPEHLRNLLCIFSIHLLRGEKGVRPPVWGVEIIPERFRNTFDNDSLTNCSDLLSSWSFGIVITYKY